MPTDNEPQESIFKRIISEYKERNKPNPKLPSAAEVGDFYYDTDTDTLYYCHGKILDKLTWVALADNVRRVE